MNHSRTVLRPLLPLDDIDQRIKRDRDARQGAFLGGISIGMAFGLLLGIIAALLYLT